MVSSGHEIEVADSQFLTIMLPSRGFAKVRLDREEHVIGAGTAFGLGPSERWTQVDKTGHRDFRANLVKISLAGTADQDIFQAPDGNPIVAITPGAVESLRGLIRYMFTDLASPMPTLTHRPASDLFGALVREHLRHMLTRAPASRPSPDRTHQSVMARAQEFMTAHASEPLTVPEIAKAVGVSPRRLQAAFRAAIGRSPWERLTEIRLQNARAQLLTGHGATVTGIALECGFSHLGRFSQAYRAAYGESPSTTLARAKDKPPQFG